MALVLALAAQGCSLSAMTGDMMSAYTVEHLSPYMMASDDLDMACLTGAAMGTYLLSFERVTDPPNKAGIQTLLSAGMCAEAEAFSAELDRLRDLRATRLADAQDARIREQRAHRVAAARFYSAFRRLEAAYGPPGEGCPGLEAPTDELLYLLGLSAGVQAVLHDRAAAGAAGVPLDVPARVARATECLDSERWWGLPAAVRAAVWTSVPGTLPEGVDPWKVLANAATIGERAGVRMARAVQVQAAWAAGRSADVRQAIRAHAAALEATRPAPATRLLDTYATAVITHFSDLLWTEAQGHRTPSGGLGAFWDDEGTSDSEVPDDDMLEGLDGPETPAQPAKKEGQ